MATRANNGGSGLNSWRSRRQTNGVEQRRQNDAAQWKTMLEMINKTTPDTMLGFGLGKLLRGSFDHWKNAREEKKAQQAWDNYAHSQELMGYSQPVQGLLGNGPGAQYDVARDFQALNPANPIGLMAMRGEQTVKQPNGEEVTTKVAGGYPFNASDYDIAAQAKAMGNNSVNNIAQNALGGQQGDYNLVDWYKQKYGY